MNNDPSGDLPGQVVRNSHRLGNQAEEQEETGEEDAENGTGMGSYGNNSIVGASLFSYLALTGEEMLGFANYGQVRVTILMGPA